MSSEGERIHDELAVLKTVDERTRARAGNLAAYGMSDHQIADTLLLTLDQVRASKISTEYRDSYAKISAERIQRKIDLEEGWDVVEERALSTLLEAMNYNRDPRFALAAARTANMATRRTPSQNNKVIEAAEGKANNIVILQMNAKFVTKQQKSDTAATIDITPRELKQIPLKRADVPSPKQVTELLAPIKEMAEKVAANALEETLKLAGVDFTEFGEDVTEDE